MPRLRRTCAPLLAAWSGLWLARRLWPDEGPVLALVVAMAVSAVAAAAVHTLIADGRGPRSASSSRGVGPHCAERGSNTTPA